MSGEHTPPPPESQATPTALQKMATPVEEASRLPASHSFWMAPPSLSSLRRRDCFQSTSTRVTQAKQSQLDQATAALTAMLTKIGQDEADKATNGRAGFKNFPGIKFQDIPDHL